MMFRYSLEQPGIDEKIHAAVDLVLGAYRTADMMAPGKTQVGCVEMGARILEAFEVGK